MGQKINPISLRLGGSAQWRSRWFDLKNYQVNLLEDYKIRKFLEIELKKAAIAKVEIDRLNTDVIVNVHTARPGVVIGRGGAGAEELRGKIKAVIGKNIKLNIIEVKNPETNAAIAAHQVVEQIEKRIPFRRAARGVMEAAARHKIDGIKIIIAGRLNGAEIARKEMFIHGRIPLHTLRNYIDYAQCTAHTTYGTVGVKVWIFKEGEKEADNNLVENKQI